MLLLLLIFDYLRYLDYSGKMNWNRIAKQFLLRYCLLTYLDLQDYLPVYQKKNLSSTLSKFDIQKFLIVNSFCSQYFSMLLGVVEQNYGDTIKFCGDAVMIMWSVEKSAEEDVKTASVIMASICALQMLQDCGKYDRGEGSHAVSLRLHCGIGCGEVHCMCVGEGSRWEFLISGDPIRQVGLAEPEAGIGEVCLSPEANDYIRHRLDSVEMPLGSFKLTGGLKRNRGASLGLLQEEPSISLTNNYDSFDVYPARQIDSSSGIFEDAVSDKMVNDIATPPASAQSIRMAPLTDVTSSPKILSKQQLNAKYVPITSARISGEGSTNYLGNSSSSSASKLTFSQLKSDSKDSHSSSDKNADVPTVVAVESNEALHGDISPFVSDKQSKGWQTCCLPLNSAARITPEVSKLERTETISPCSEISPHPSKLTAKKSFLLEIGHRFTESFSLAAKKSRSYSNFDHDISYSYDGPKDINTMKSLLSADLEPGMTKAMRYLSDINNSYSHSEKRCPVTTSYSTSLFADDREEAARQLRCFLHEAALKAVESDLFDFGYLAEKRTVVTMFIEVIGIENEFKIGEVLRPQRVFSFVLACLSRFEGSLRQYVFDDKGCVIIAAFGLPGTHHEDNCTRAVETARAILKSMEMIKISCRIGIAMGSVYCGLVGSSSRCEYAMMGSSVNLAARLMTHCSPGSILVNDTVYNEALDDFEFQTLEPIVAKGYEKRVPVYTPTNRVQSRAVGLGQRINQPAKFVGRAEEKLMFGQDLMNFGYGVNKFTRTIGHIIDGPPGIGKTSLVAEINDLAQSNANIDTIIIASASASHISSSYFVVRQILDFILTKKLCKPSSGGRRNKSVNGSPIPVGHRDSESSKTQNSKVKLSNSVSNFSEPPDAESKLLLNAKSFIRMPSSIMDKSFMSFGADSNSNPIFELENWLLDLEEEIMVTELSTLR